MLKEKTIEIDLSQVQFPDNAAEEYKNAREQRRAQMSVGGYKQEDIDTMVPINQWEPISVCISLLQNAVEAYYHKKYFSAERRIVVAPAAVRNMKAFLFRKMKKDGKFTVTLAELQLFDEALKEDLQAMDGYSYVAEYITGLLAANTPVEAAG